MTQRYLLAVVAFLVLALTLLSTSVLAGPGDNTPLESQLQSPDEVHRTSPSAPTGYYLENGRWSFLNADAYHATGSFRFWTWEELNPAPGIYRWNWLDQYINDAAANGYESVGIAMLTYTGRYVACPLQGVEMTPYFVRWGSDGIEGTADDPILLSQVTDWRQGSSCNTGGPWYLLNYLNPYYQDQYQIFVEALADHLLTHPQRDRIGWVAIGTGKDGENIPTNNEDDQTLLDLGVSSNDWVAYVEDVIDIYHAAFSDGGPRPQIDIVTQNAPFYREPRERRDIAAYAATKDVGVSINGVASDFSFIEACESAIPGRHCAGMYDQALLHGDSIPIMLESYAYMMGSPNEFYWAMARALDVHADYIRLSDFWNSEDTPANRIIAEWSSRYMGRGLQAGDNRPASVWSRMREHRSPTYLSYATIPRGQYDFWPTNGNYEYYLYQEHEAPGGITIPLTDDARFLTNNGIMGWDSSESNVLDKPWHYNTDPYSADLYGAGLLHVEVVDNAGNAVQIEVDPGWVARRSDQTTGNFGFFFDVDDRYLTAPANPADGHEVRITVTFLDQGDDRWQLKYDGAQGESAATLYAIQDWDVATGLALNLGLPGSGVLPEPRPQFVQKSNSNRWKVATFVIDDGYFGNRLAGSTDFYVDSRSPESANDGDEYIHHIDVLNLNEVPQITPTPTPTGQVPTVTPTPSPTPDGNSGSASGYVFEDLNGNGNREEYEPPLPGVLMQLFPSFEVNPIQSTVTDNQGFYRFSNLLAGLYRIRPTAPDGWTMRLYERYVNISTGQESANINFAAERAETLTPTPTATGTPTVTPTLTPPPDGGTLLGLVWNDENRNKVIDDGETGVEAVRLQVKSPAGYVLQEDDSDSEGRYRFTGLAPSTYQLVVEIPAGWEATTPSNQWLAPGAGELTVNFGIALMPSPTPAPTETPTITPTPTETPRPAGSIHAFVWIDHNQNGLREADEAGLPGATIVVRSQSGDLEVARLTTDDMGYALFDDLLAPGSYRVTEIDPPGMFSTTPNEARATISDGATLDIYFGDYFEGQPHFLPMLLSDSHSGH